MHGSTDEKIIEQISAEFPGWRVWRPRRWDDRPSSWAATRRDESAGVDPTVMASTAEQLRAALAEQRDAVERTGRIPVAPEVFPAGDARSASIARVYDCWLGGKDHYPADRQLAKAMTAAVPQLPAAARANRAFLRRAVTHLAGQGITQFLDIGTGLPTAGPVHEIAQAVNPGARVVYVDTDPLVVAHGTALLATGEGTAMVEGDLLAPQVILGHPEVRALIDFDRPVGLLLAAVLHFLPEPAPILAVLRDALPPGSFLVISHGQAQDDQGVLAAAELYNRHAAVLKLRTREDITAFFDGWELVEPGVVPVNAWRPDLVPAITPQGSGADRAARDIAVLGGVARASGESS